jgi:ribulose-phosphate 3-epimerase
MSVNPGFGGQKFIESILKKINEANKLREEKKLNFLIEVDGGIDKENVKDILNAGCDIFVIGSSIFKGDNVSATTLEFKNLLKDI